MKFFWRIGALCALVFVILFSIRINLIGKILPASQPVFDSSVVSLSERDTWMNISHKDRKIGFSHATVSKNDNGYRLWESLYMRINTMGMVQELNLKTRADLFPDLSIARFDFEISSGRFRFAAKGSFSRDRLIVRAQSAGISRSYDIEVKSKPYLAAGLADAVIAEGVNPGETRTFNVFDPATMGQTSILIRVVGKEEILSMGRMQAATKVRLTYKGMSQQAWIGENGEVLREEGLMGIRLEKTTRSDALFGLPVKASPDLTRVVSVPSNVILKSPADLAKLTVKIDGVAVAHLDLDGGRQRLKGDLLTIEKETLSRSTLNDFFVNDAFLKPSLFIESDHEKIRRLAKKIVSDTRSPIKKAEKILSWIDQHIEKRPVLSVPDALSTLENRVGDCNEHAVLMAALSRAAGIPAGIETGLVYLKGRFYYHAWNLLYLGRWVTADALFNQLPADVTHIRFSSGISENPLDLMAVIGKVKLAVIEP